MVREDKKSFKEDILKMREDGFSYGEIKQKLGCTKATISYHCNRWSLNDIGLSNKKIENEEIEEIKQYYKTHTAKETSEKFEISISSVKKYSDRKLEILTIEEKKKRNYKHVRTYIQTTKEKAIEYKGGKCEVCGYDKCSWSLDFHHKDPNEKEFGISSAGCKSWKKIKNELDKCILVCKNCHGEIHHEIEQNKIE